jgi:homoprotocatechuate degradation regulator HpaR
MQCAAMSKARSKQLAPYPRSLAGTLLAAREAVMAPIRPRLRATGVTDPQWRVLRVLNDVDTMDAQGIATTALLHAPSVTRILKELLDRRLIERQIDPHDGRRSIIRITTLGKELVAATAPATLEVLSAYEQAFGAERLEAMRIEIEAFVRTITNATFPEGQMSAPDEQAPQE